MQNDQSNQWILVTGGAGFIGSHAVKLFLEKGYKVVIFDNLYRGFRQAVEKLQTFGQVEFVQGDLRIAQDIESTFDKYNIAGVLHFAALCLVDESMRTPELYFQNNVIGSLNLFEAMRHHEVKKIIFSSTCAVYGDSQYLPIDEKHPTNPLSPYGESKLQTEKMLGWYGMLHGFHYAILRYFNVCGAASDGSIGDSKKPSQLLMQNAVRGAMKIDTFQYTFPPVDTPDGSPIRDYIDVEDLAAAHYAAYLYLLSGGESGVFNLGNGQGFSVKEIVEEVEKEFDITMEKNNAAQPRQGEYAAVYANPAKAEKELSWAPHKTIQDSITSMKLWYTAHPHGWDE